nr:hypothetical protein [uncultured Bacteroides sp.]
MMKKIVLLSVLFCFPINILLAQKIKNAVIVEENYLVRDNGTIDYNSIIKTKKIRYDKDGRVLYCHEKDKKCKTDQIFESNEFTSIDRSDNDSLIQHICKYNEKGDITEHKVISPNNTSLFTYEYFYLGAFTYKKKNRKQFIDGYVPQNVWVRRTTLKDGKVVEVINRKIANK